jgi:hypothetical protein
MVRTYMLYGLHGYTDLRPQQVFPANLSLCDMRQSVGGGKVCDIFIEIKH